MEIIDSQIHVWESDRPSRPWIPEYRRQHRHSIPHLQNAGQTMTPEMVLIEMAEAGVDGGVLSPIGVYGTSNEDVLGPAGKYPSKFTAQGWVDPTADRLEELLDQQRAQGLTSVRVVTMRDADRHRRREFDRLLAYCTDTNLPVSFSLVHPLPEEITDMLRRYTKVPFLIDHVGVGFAPPVLGPTTPGNFDNLPAVLELAQFPNVHMKISGAPALSKEEYPYRDIWKPLSMTIEAFGPERVLWGSDFSRTAGLHGYWWGTQYLREASLCGDDDLALIYGQNTKRILGWDRPAALPSSTSA